MAKRVSIAIALVISSAVMAWLLSRVMPAPAPTDAPPLATHHDNEPALGAYPDTGLPDIARSETEIQRADLVAFSDLAHPSYPTTSAAAFEDTIRPDEDLLQGINNTPPSSVQPAVPQQPVTTVPTTPRPTIQAPAIQPASPKQQDPIEPEPVDLPQPSENLTPTAPLTDPNPGNALDPPNADPQSSKYDPYAAPSADEDLLQAMPDRGQNRPKSEGPLQPIEVLPARPQADPGLNLNPSTNDSQPTTQPPSSAPVTPFVPPSNVVPLAPHGSGSTPANSGLSPGVDPHAEVFAETLYPSAKQCRSCHEQIYDEWAVSSHAYAAISPMFQKFEQTISQLTRGTIGYFCMRCHAPVATAMNHPREASIFSAVDSADEGVTCIACHRVREQYGKSNGERRIEPGDIHEPVYGSGYGEGLRDVLNKKASYKVKPFPEQGPGQDIHRQVIHFEQISDSSFCVSCHQVFVAPGIELEVVWEQYRASPACKQGISCQDCHMGIQPGLAEGYETAPVAVINDKPISPDRKHSNHVFYGPGYSIAHPGIFPHNPDAEDWTKEEWLQFDYRGGWGTDPFEDAVKDGLVRVAFPKVWENSDDRYDAREIVDANLARLRDKLHTRRQLMENSSHIEGPIFDSNARVGKPLKFHYVVSNTASGHNMPSGSLGAQPQLWVNVALTGPNGEHLWESGYVDSNGDIADLHSLDVAAGKVPRDQQLVNYQTKFLITGVKGTDREMYLPINVDFDQLPFIRPSAFPVTVMNHPPFIRMEAHSIPPLGSRNAVYKVPGRLIQRPGRYRLSVRMRSRAEPIYFMRFCNATPEMERNMNEWMLDYHEHATEFLVQ